MVDEARLEPVASGLAPAVYKRSDTALRHGASVEADTTSVEEANAPWRGGWRVARPEPWNELPWS